MTDAPIGIFDSGVGGLTVARAVRDQLPNEEIVANFGGSGGLIAAAIGSIVVGLITAVLGGGLLRGSNPARLIVTVLQVLSILGSLFMAVAYIGDPTVVGEWLGVAVSATLLILLWTPKASRFFDPSVTS